MIKARLPLVWTFLSNAMITSSTEPLQICRLSVAKSVNVRGAQETYDNNIITCLSSR
jgi:hypothetical protein